MTKNNNKIPQFPKIYRIITENKVFKKISILEFGLLNQSKHNKYITYFLLSTMLIFITSTIIGVFVLGFKLYQETNSYVTVTSKRQDLQKKINFWQSFIQKYDGYKDAYFQIALLEYQLGNFKKAREYNNKALLLDPGFNDAKSLEVLLEDK